MKKAISILLALLLLFSCASADKWLGGDGWWDDSYTGNLQYHPETGMTWKLPSGWIYTGYNDFQKMYEYSDPTGVFTISVFRRDDMGLYDLEPYYSFTKDDERSMIILKNDRDWFIFANEDHMVGYCEGKKGGLFGITMYFPRNADNRKIARRIISSVD